MPSSTTVWIHYAQSVVLNLSKRQMIAAIFRPNIYRTQTSVLTFYPFTFHVASLSLQTFDLSWKYCIYTVYIDHQGTQTINSSYFGDSSLFHQCLCMFYVFLEIFKLLDGALLKLTRNALQCNDFN